MRESVLKAARLPLAAFVASLLQAGILGAAPEAFMFEVIAGKVGEAAYVDHANSSEARFKYPSSVAVDQAGNIVVVDLSAHAIRRVKAAGGVETVAGNGSAGYANGTGSAALFNQPQAAVLDVSGAIYVTDRRNAALRRISPDGTVATLAGGTEAGIVDGTGPDARFHWPFGLTRGQGGDFLLSDLFAHNIRRVTPAGNATIFSGPSAASPGHADGASAEARFNQPFALAAGPGGSIFVADAENNVIRSISPEGTVSTLAGMAGQAGRNDGAGSAARLAYPRALAWGGAEHLYFVDGGGLRRVGLDGVVTTLAAYEKETGGPVPFTAVEGMTFDQAGRLILADGANRVIRRGAPAPILRVQRAEHAILRLNVAGTGAASEIEVADSLSPANWRPLADQQATALSDSALVLPDTGRKERYFRSRSAQ